MPDGSFLPFSVAIPSAVSSSSSDQHPIATLLGPCVSSEGNPSAISWGKPIPAISGNIFPPLSLIMALLVYECPGPSWIQLEEFLWEAGVNSSEHILLANLTVLALVENMRK